MKNITHSFSVILLTVACGAQADPGEYPRETRLSRVRGIQKLT